MCYNGSVPKQLRRNQPPSTTISWVRSIFCGKPKEEVAALSVKDRAVKLMEVEGDGVRFSISGLFSVYCRSSRTLLWSIVNICEYLVASCWVFCFSVVSKHVKTNDDLMAMTAVFFVSSVLAITCNHCNWQDQLGCVIKAMVRVQLETCMWWSQDPVITGPSRFNVAEKSSVASPALLEGPVQTCSSMVGTSVRYSSSGYMAQNDVQKLKDWAFFLARFQKADLPLVNPEPWMFARHAPIVNESCDLSRCSGWILILKIDMGGLASFSLRPGSTSYKYMVCWLLV